MTNRLLRTNHARGFLARQRWRTAESRRLGVPDAKAFRMPTRTRKPKPYRADTRGRGSSSRDYPATPSGRGAPSHGRWAGPPRSAVLSAEASLRACDNVRVVPGVAQAHGGLEAREVQGKARVAAVQLLRLAEKLRLEGLRRFEEADTVGADLREEPKFQRPEAERTPRLGRKGTLREPQTALHHPVSPVQQGSNPARARRGALPAKRRWLGCRAGTGLGTQPVGP